MELLSSFDWFWCYSLPISTIFPASNCVMGTVVAGQATGVWLKLMCNYCCLLCLACNNPQISFKTLDPMGHPILTITMVLPPTCSPSPRHRQGTCGTWRVMRLESAYRMEKHGEPPGLCIRTHNVLDTVDMTSGAGNIKHIKRKCEQGTYLRHQMVEAASPLMAHGQPPKILTRRTVSWVSCNSCAMPHST